MWTALKFILACIPVLIRAACGSPVELIFRESSLSVLVIYNDYCPASWLTDIFGNPKIPVVIRSAIDAHPILQQFSRPLHVLCLPGRELQFDRKLLQNLATSLEGFPQQHVVLYLANSSSDRNRMDALFQASYDFRIQNVVCLSASDERIYFYRYHRYPIFRTEQKPLQSSHIFEKQSPNMQGHPLIVIPDQWLPRSILYVNRRTGNKILAGSVGRFIHVLAWKLNATLQLTEEVTPGRFLQTNELRELDKEICIDVSASMSMLEREDQLPRTSYPLELTHICLMIPVAQEIPLKDIYWHLSSATNMILAVTIVYAFGLVLCLLRVLRSDNVRLVDFLLNDRALRGVLGQSFMLSWPRRGNSSRCIYLMLGIVGLNVSSIFEAALETMMAHPPREFQAQSFSDLRRTRMPLVTTPEDLHTVVDKHLNLLVVNVSEYHHLRSGGNASSAYFASRLHWTLFNEQQKRFTRQLFIYSTDACLWSLALLSFQWPQSSWLAEPVSKLILEIRANGLYQFWVGMHHYDMTEAGLAGLEDPSLTEDVKGCAALRLDDLQWVWLAYEVLVAVSSLVFLLEMIWKRLGFTHLFDNSINFINNYGAN
ncbi:uncharacterized protein LOC110191441 [Drosophila serrata]|uniref:uncharacterized protein LOC110191441 n=1 Tax=Drosophila serrata TaxID=7274 RepID=UPI000A1D0132|nr:uncharacterized protein LOC110191441 [Drosophila serrata]